MRHDEHRRHPRAQLTAVAALQTLGRLNANDQGIATVRDVSRSGIGLRTGQPPLQGQAVILRLGIGDEILELTTLATRVRRCGDSHFYDVGLDWSNCSAEQLAFLDRFVELAEVQPQD
ncbi:MAG: PilZ domain-containing protein [Planctomycetes bacterium]|nr:PilZ domain-containing protein [Planctomycetota bacterium]